MPAEQKTGGSTSVFQAIVLGIVQGLTEFAPVSSSGHLILVPWLFHWTFFLQNPDLNKTFDVALHLGTFLGAVAYFWRDLARLVPAGLGALARRKIATTEERLAWLLLLSAVPGAYARTVKFMAPVAEKGAGGKSVA